MMNYLLGSPINFLIPGFYIAHNPYPTKIHHQHPKKPPEILLIGYQINSREQTSLRGLAWINMHKFGCVSEMYPKDCSLKTL